MQISIWRKLWRMQKARYRAYSAFSTISLTNQLRSKRSQQYYTLQCMQKLEKQPDNCKQNLLILQQFGQKNNHQLQCLKINREPFYFILRCFMSFTFTLICEEIKHMRTCKHKGISAGMHTVGRRGQELLSREEQRHEKLSKSYFKRWAPKRSANI